MFLIIVVIINNSKFQKKIITNYVSQVSIENDKLIELKDLDYNFFSGYFYTDLYLLEKNKLDTVLNIPEFSFKLSLLDILFSKSLEINKIIIDSPKLIKSKKSNNKNSIFTLLSKINKISRELLVSEIQLKNITLSGYFPDEIDGLNLNMKHVNVNQLDFSIQDILIQKDNSFIQTKLFYRDSVLFLNIDSSFINTQNDIFTVYYQSISDTIFNSNHIKLFGDFQFHQEDSIDIKSQILTGNSHFNLNISKNSHNIWLDLKNIHFDLEDFNFSQQNQFFPKDMTFQGECVFTDYKSSNIIAKGNLSMDYGAIDYLFELDSLDHHHLTFSLQDFNLGKVFQKYPIGNTNAFARLSFINQHVDSFLFDVSNLLYNGYTYDSILLRGQLFDDNNGSIFVKISDQNIDAQAFASLNKRIKYDSWNSPIISNVNGLINYANLYNLKIPVNKSLDFISTKFVINEINRDSLNSMIKFNDFNYQIDNNVKTIDYIDLNLSNIDLKYANMNLNSSIGTLITSFEYQQNKLVNFRCDANLSKASVISDIFSNQYKFDDSLEMSIIYDNFNLSHFMFKSPKLSSSNTTLIDIDISTRQSEYPAIKCLIDKVNFSDKISLNDLSLLVDLQTKKNGSYQLTYSSDELQEKQGDISGDINIQKNNMIFDFNSKSFINFSNKAWFIDSLSKIILDEKGLHFDQFTIKLNQESLIIDGYLNKKPNLNFSFHQFALHHINPFLSNPLMTFDGLLRGDVFYNKSLFPSLAGNFEVDDFIFNNIHLGKLNLNNSFNTQNDSLHTFGVITNKEDIMRFEAQYPLDGSNYINADISLKNFPSAVLDDLIKPISNVSGNTYGDINLTGLINNYNLSGNIKTNNVMFDVPYLKQTYFNDIDTLETIFTNNSIIIQDFTLYDNQYKTKAMLYGNIEHRALKNMAYQLFIDTDSLFILNTSDLHNENYYGRGFLGGNMKINGGPDKTTLDIDAEAKAGSSLMIPLTNSREIRENEFIQFSRNNNKEQTLIKNQKSTFNMNFNLDIQNNSQIQLIFDEEIGDLIKGYGQGSLYLKINDLGDLEVFGDFVIEDGNYLFTLQDVITKSFQIKNGGLIRFNGHPHNAVIDLDVLYNVQASLNPLNSDYDRQVKSPVICGMKMSKDLLNPDIDFFIDIPNSDQIIETSLETLTNTDQKLLQQFLYLLIANSFLIENDPSIDYLGSTLATTGTELLSNQLSNWLSQTTDAFDLGFKWVPGTGDSLSYQQVELAVSKKFLDDRVIVNGNVGTPPEQSQADIIGDLDIEYNFFKDGRLKLRVFNRAEDYDPLSESLGYEQGFGIFFKNQFDSFKELFKRNKKKNK